MEDTSVSIQDKIVKIASKDDRAALIILFDQGEILNTAGETLLAMNAYRDSAIAYRRAHAVLREYVLGAESKVKQLEVDCEIHRMWHETLNLQNTTLPLNYRLADKHQINEILVEIFSEEKFRNLYQYISRRVYAERSVLTYCRVAMAKYFGLEAMYPSFLVGSDLKIAYDILAHEIARRLERLAENKRPITALMLEQFLTLQFYRLRGELGYMYFTLCDEDNPLTAEKAQNYREKLASLSYLVNETFSESTREEKVCREYLERELGNLADLHSYLLQKRSITIDIIEMESAKVPAYDDTNWHFDPFYWEEKIGELLNTTYLMTQKADSASGVSRFKEIATRSYGLISYYYDEQAVVVESWLASMSPKAENKQLLQEIKLAFVELRNNTKVFMNFLEKCSSVVTRERMLAAIGAFATERNRASTVLFEKLLNIS